VKPAIGSSFKIAVEEPKPVGEGWLVRLRVRNNGQPTTLTASLVDVHGIQAGQRGPLPRILTWRNHPGGAIDLDRGQSELVRLAILRPDRGEVLLLGGSGDEAGEQRVAATGMESLIATVRLTNGTKTVEQQVRLSFEVRAGELAPVVAFASKSEAERMPEPSESADSIAAAGNGAKQLIAEEARRFGEQDNEALRDTNWNAIPVFRRRVARLFDMGAYVRNHLEGHEHPVGLTLACGDMSAEYPFFKTVGVREVDAFDISEGQRAKFLAVYDHAIPVNYMIADANTIELEPGRYDLVYLKHAYHHVEALEHVADEIVKALKPHGILAINDYIGTNFLQRSPRERDLCGAIWRSMPERYRIALNGRVVPELRIPAIHTLPPYEAVRSEDILEVLTTRFETLEMVGYAGILLPLFNGFAQHYTDSPEDEAFVRIMWDLDMWLLQSGAITPNLMKAIFAPRR
jgi:SAM-dependent methyltransferase